MRKRREDMSHSQSFTKWNSPVGDFARSAFGVRSVLAPLSGYREAGPDELPIGRTFAKHGPLKFRINSHAIAGTFVAVFECELGDSGLVEVAESIGNHAVVLVLCGARQRQVETQIAREFERDPAVLRGVCG